LEKERTAEPPSELNGHGETAVERQMSPVATVPSAAAVKETSVAVAGAKDVPSVAVTAAAATKEEERPQQSYLGGFAKCAHNKMQTGQFLHIFLPDLDIGDQHITVIVLYRIGVEINNQHII
jgi:outer membrane receptor protein involved in Fe transport